MEKSAVARQYRYDHYHHTTTTPQQQQQKTNGKTASLKHAATVEHHGGCLCFGGRTEGGYVQGVFSNLGICALLVGYTLLGSFVFMAIEGGGQSFLRGGAAVVDDRRQNETSSWLKRVADESRARTVENIWDITVSLNILYRDNWTRLAAQEISRFQDQLVQRLSDEMMLQQQQRAREMGYTAERRLPGSPYEWNFARAFLYSLTVLTTIGYGNIAPRTALGKAVTMGYAVFGIPLMLIYLSSVGSLLSRCVRGVFSRTVCCCFCSNCGYCCYDEKRMQEKERRMKKKRMQEMEMQQQQQQQQQEPFYVRSSSSVTAFTTSASSTHNNLHSPVRDGDVLKHSASMLDQEYGAPADNSDSNLGSGSLGRSYSAGSIMAPILLCLLIMLCYICGGAAVLTRLEAWSFLDGSYFCFMSLSTIGFGDLVPGGMVAHYHQRNSSGRQPFGGGNGTVWFCSMYILTGMALTAMCFNILHDEIVHRLRHTSLGVAAVSGTQLHQDLTSSSDKGNSYLGESGGADPYSTTS